MSSFSEDEAHTRAANIDYYKNILRDRSVSHPQLCQEIHAPKPAADASSNFPFTFVIGADTQLGRLNVRLN